MAIVASHYSGLVADLSGLIEAARGRVARSVNDVMTATYWEFGRRIVTYEMDGKSRAGYGEELIASLATDLTAKFGRGFSRVNLTLMRRFYLEWPREPIVQTASEQSHGGSAAFPLPWSHYVRLMSVPNVAARRFYEAEALRGGWSVRQLDRQISTQFYERSPHTSTETVVEHPSSSDLADAVKDPFVLEFLNLPDPLGESDLEHALLRHLEDFLLELGDDFAFVGRQRRLRIGDLWYRVDLLCFHRRLRALVVIDLKIGRFSHADAGQMHLYLNYARAHWVKSGENPPVGLILCSEKHDALAKYALEGLPNPIVAREYQLALPNERRIAEELGRTRREIADRKVSKEMLS